MITLSQILTLKNQIASLAEQFGFEPDVKFFDQEKDLILRLLVKESTKKNISYKATEYLKAKLTELIGCKIDLINYDRLNELYKETYLKNSVSLEEDALKKRLNLTRLQTITFEKRAEADLLFTIVLGQADNFLDEKQMNKSSIALFKPESKDTSQVKMNMAICGNEVTLHISLPENFDTSNTRNKEMIEKLANDFKENLNLIGKDENKFVPKSSF